MAVRAVAAGPAAMIPWQVNFEGRTSVARRSKVGTIPSQLLTSMTRGGGGAAVVATVEGGVVTTVVFTAAAVVGVVLVVGKVVGRVGGGQFVLPTNWQNISSGTSRSLPVRPKTLLISEKKNGNFENVK